MASSLQRVSPLVYIYKEECLYVCLSVRYVFSPRKSYRHQTFHGASPSPEDGHRGVTLPVGVGVGVGVKFHPGYDATKLC